MGEEVLVRSGFLLHWFLFGGVDDEGFRDSVQP